MKILWVVNTVFPDAARSLGIETPVFGGWMYGLAADIAKSEKLKIAVATVYTGREMKILDINNIRYFLIPQQRRFRKTGGTSSYWRTVVRYFSPDLVHIHGTEFDYGLRLIEACPKLKYVISVQGLVSVCHRYYMAGMSNLDIISNITFRDLIRWDTLYNAKHKFFKRGLIEKQYILRADAVIGRTDWDRAHTQSIKPNVKYYFCNESLRDEFYSGEKWSLDNCRRYSIFLSQAGYPIKGLHQVIKAVSLLKEEYPHITIEIAGSNITKTQTLRDRLKISGYGSYINSLIKFFGLRGKVNFIGLLDAKAMKEAYLRANVFICPSSIENSSNSIGEAQILGVPVIASYVGGVASMLRNSISAKMYEFNSYEVLAQYISEVFKTVDYSLLNTDMVDAQKRHNRATNCMRHSEIYCSLIDV